MTHPDSWEEKRKATGTQHWIFVHEMQRFLSQLEPDDWLTPNTVGNLSVGRGDNSNIGIINFHCTGLEFWDTKEE